MAGRERLLMDTGWRFHRGDCPYSKYGLQWAKGGNFGGAADPRFDDSQWRLVDLPHDFVVEGDFVREPEPGAGSEPLKPDSPAWHHMMHGFLPGGVGWYRRAFEVPEADWGRRLALEFDGVFRNCTVWLNRHFVGQYRSGYIGFRADITDIVNYGGLNTLAVRVDATEYEGWFYEGGGIYRHVWLVKTDGLHVAPHGLFVVCEADWRGSAPRARAVLRIELRNAQSAARRGIVKSVIRDAAGRQVAAAASEFELAPQAHTALEQRIEIAPAELWSLERPYLYTAATTLEVDGKAVDECAVAFGARHIHFDPDRGFFLNGQPVKLKGVCCHQDHAGVGAALPDRIQDYRIERLKEMGCNAYRTAHHPPTPELLDACDRLGMLVMDETRLLDSSAEYLAQLEGLVRRDRNHPAIILWSLGNEEHLIHGTETGARIAQTMKERVRALDPTRPVTLAMNGAWGEGAARVVDVMGCNYISTGDIDAFHRRFPAQPVLYSEAVSAVNTRGVYERDPQRGYVSALDKTAAAWGHTHEANWQHCVARPFVAGTFIWTGLDYRGEPTPYYDWPCISSHFGIFDTCGFPKAVFYYYQAWWTERPMMHLCPHWNWPGREGAEIEVWVYSNCDAVELKLNGASLGRQIMPRNGHLEWKVKYAPGALEAVGYRSGRPAAAAKVETTGAPAALRLVPDRPELRADGEDVALVRVEVVDGEGRVAPTAGHRIAFEVSANTRILGVGNGDPACHEADKGSVRSAFNGLCQVIVQTTAEAGVIRLTARADGLRAGVLEFPARACALRPHVAGAATVGALTFECSPIQPPPAGGIGAAALPPAALSFAPVAGVAFGNLCDVRPFYEGKDGMVYIRSRTTLGKGGAGALWYGADGPVKVWVNGADAGCQPTATNPAQPDEYKTRIEWRAGVNEILFALANNGGKAWGIYARATVS